MRTKLSILIQNIEQLSKTKSAIYFLWHKTSWWLCNGCTNWREDNHELGPWSDEV